MTKIYAGYDIRSGFLGGNILADDLGHERPVDENASCARYAKLCREAIEAEYPGADVSIDYEVNASGSTPCTLETNVLTADGAGNIGAYGNEANRIADHVDNIMGRVWEDYEWVVYEEVEADDELTNDDKLKLGHITTRNEAGTHFTQVYPDAWLQRMERLGWISIHRPVHGPTSIPYSQDYWTVEVNEEVASWFDAYGNLIGSDDEETTIKYRGVVLRRRTEVGPRGGTRYIYQAAEASPAWGYWYQSAAQAVVESNSSDRVTAR